MSIQKIAGERRKRSVLGKGTCQRKDRKVFIQEHGLTEKATEDDALRRERGSATEKKKEGTDHDLAS